MKSHVGLHAIRLLELMGISRDEIYESRYGLGWCFVLLASVHNEE
jgi:hypothetical protein